MDGAFVEGKQPLGVGVVRVSEVRCCSAYVVGAGHRGGARQFEGCKGRIKTHTANEAGVLLGVVAFHDARQAKVCVNVAGEQAERTGHWPVGFCIVVKFVVSGGGGESSAE